MSDEHQMLPHLEDERERLERLRLLPLRERERLLPLRDRERPRPRGLGDRPPSSALASCSSFCRWKESSL